MKAFLIMIMLAMFSSNCSTNNNDEDPPVKPEVPKVENEVDFYLTKNDESQKLKKQPEVVVFGNSYNGYPTIKVNAAETFQTIDGFGFSLTGGSAELINQLTASKKGELLQKLFGKGENAISINYLRISIGASDLDSSTFSYNDLPEGQTDEDLSEFSLEPDLDDLIPLLKEILEINPKIKIMGTPWSPPVWMKDNNSTIGGSLLPKYYSVYADYLVKYIKEMNKLGIDIEAITPQNEPLHAKNNPSMLMLASEQADFIKNHLGPAFREANLDTKIIIYDHNADKPEYPLALLNDAGARQYIAGSAFHLYAGDISALSTVHAAYPDKDVYFTEQYTSSTGEFGGDLNWHLRNVIIGSMRNWSKTAFEWNLANNTSFGPHTEGGCTTCKGAITIKGSTSYEENVGFYIIGHVSKFVPAGSVRIGSNITGNLQNVAFKTPDGKKVLIVLNGGQNFEMFNIDYNGKWITASLDSGSVATFVW